MGGRGAEQRVGAWDGVLIQSQLLESGFNRS